MKHHDSRDSDPVAPSQGRGHEAGVGDVVGRDRRPIPELVDGMQISYPADWRSIPQDIWHSMRMTPAEYERMRAERVERERGSPKVGEAAPDFEAERLSSGAERTGQSFRLSSTRGRPVALVFGSYT